jgi:hypothetical protein
VEFAGLLISTAIAAAPRNMFVVGVAATENDRFIESPLCCLKRQEALPHALTCARRPDGGLSLGIATNVFGCDIFADAREITRSDDPQSNNA